MTDSRGNKAGEQSNRAKSVENVKWNENPSISGYAWVAKFKRRSIPTSVSNSDWRFIRQANGLLLTVKNDGSDVIDQEDYQKYMRFLRGKSGSFAQRYDVGCLYYGDGKLAPGAFHDCLRGFAVFHDYSVG